MTNSQKFTKVLDVLIIIIGAAGAAILFTLNLVALLVAIIVGAVWRQ